MSRALRKAQRKQLESLPVVEPPAESDEEDEESENVATAPNPFDLLNAAEQGSVPEEKDVEHDEELDQDEEEDLQAAIAASTASTNQGHGKKKSKKKKKAKKASEPASVAEADDENDFDAVLRAHKAAIADASVPEEEQKPFNMVELLSIDVKMLDPNVEMRKLFGSKVVSSERAERMTMNRRNMPRGMQQQLSRGRKSVLVPMEDNYPLTIKGGLEMEMQEDMDNIKTFKFVHSKSYQQTQFMFLQCVQSGDPQTLMNLLSRAPFHVDTLLQVSEILRHQGNNEQSEEMLTRALFAFDRAFHPRFSIASGLVRLPFEIPENRPFYLAIYRYIQLLGRRGCWATAFEFNKLLYAMAPEEDPYAALLSIDFYAIKARNWPYIEKLTRCPWDQVLDHNFAKPNLQYAKALANVLSVQKGESNDSAKTEMSTAIRSYPYFVGPLFAELKATGPVQYDALEPANDFGRLTRDLYTFRAKDIYNTPELTKFLRDAALPVTDFTPMDLDDEIPTNVSRHILLLDERSLLHYLPKSITASPGMSYDPLPPEDSLPSYMDEFLPSSASGAVTGEEPTRIRGFIQDLLNRLMPGGPNAPQTDEEYAQVAQMLEHMNIAEDGQFPQDNEFMDDDEVGGFADPNGYGPNRGIDEPEQEGNAGRP